MLRFFRSLSIRVRLVLLTGILSLFLVLVAFIGYYDLKKAEADLDAMYRDILLPVQWLNDNRANFQAIRGNLLALMLTENQGRERELLADILRRREIDNENLKNYRETHLDAFEREHFREAEKHIAAFRQASEEVIRLATVGGKDAEAYEAYRNHAQGPLNDFQR